jgi:hypothetical protein
MECFKRRGDKPLGIELVSFPKLQEQEFLLSPFPVPWKERSPGRRIMTSAPLTLNLIEGSVRFSFSAAAAADLKSTLAVLLDSLKTVATKVSPGTRATPQKPMEYQYTGEVFLEIFCNPNIWSSPFVAKVLVTLRDDRIRLTTEAELSRLIEDVNQYLEQVG